MEVFVSAVNPKSFVNHFFSFFDFGEFFKSFCFSVIKFKKKCLWFFVISSFKNFFWWIEAKIEKRNSFNSLICSLYGSIEAVNFVRTKGLVWNWVLIFVNSYWLIIMSNCFFIITQLNLFITFVLVSDWFFSSFYCLNPILNLTFYLFI